MKSDEPDAAQSEVVANITGENTSNAGFIRCYPTDSCQMLNVTKGSRKLYEFE